MPLYFYFHTYIVRFSVWNVLFAVIWKMRCELADKFLNFRLNGLISKLMRKFICRIKTSEYKGLLWKKVGFEGEILNFWMFTFLRISLIKLKIIERKKLQKFLK